MKKLIKSKKGIVALLATLTVVAISAVGAYAYFVAPGGVGSGTATVGSCKRDLRSAPRRSANLYPGGADVPGHAHDHEPGRRLASTSAPSMARSSAGAPAARQYRAGSRRTRVNADVTDPGRRLRLR